MRNSTRIVSELSIRGWEFIWARSPRRWVCRVLLVVTAMLLTSCEDADRARREGYRQGHDVGYEEGQKDGYKVGYEAGQKTGHEKGYVEGKNTGDQQGRTAQLQEDWNTLYAGNHSHRAAWLQWVEAVIVCLAAWLLLGLLGWQIVRLVMDSVVPTQVVVKAAAALGGGACAFWAADRMSLFALGLAPLGLVSFFLAPAPTFAFWHLGWIGLGFLPSLAALWYCGIFLNRPRDYTGRAGIHAAVFSILVTILLPVFVCCFNTPDVARFRVFDLALGFIGALTFYFLWPVFQGGAEHR